MQPWECVDVDTAPDDDTTLFLMVRGDEFAILVDDKELMSNREHGSEDALADLACDRLDDLHAARILVGGLGMGFTLAAALKRVGPQGQVTVAELVEAVIRWNEEYTGAAAGWPIEDPRSDIVEGDVIDLLDPSEGLWNAILLDVDNGPTSLTRPENSRLYSDDGLALIRSRLAAGGVLGVWSAWPEDGFSERLTAAGFDVDFIRHVEEGRSTPDGTGAHYLWMARKV